MKLFNKTIDRQLFKQYSLGSDLSKQEVVVKIFNPTGAGNWFILNSDPQDPDYLWAIVDLGYGAEVGSVSRNDLETYRGRFGLGFERDLGFDPMNAEELYQGLINGEYYSDGGEMQVKDTWQNIFEEFGFKKGRSKYGLDMYYKRGYIGSVDHELRNVDLMFEDDVIYRGFSVQGLLNALENQFGKRNFADGGGVNVGYNVFNYTDNIYATDEVFKTKALANKFIKEFRSRYANQGYYRDNRMNKINIQDIDLLAIPSNFNPFKKYADGGGIEEHKPYVFYFYYDGNEMTFNTLEKALKEAKQYGAMKVRDNLGGEYFLNYADGGNIDDFTDNQQMIMNQNVELEHHHEELEDILKDEMPVPAWVVAKMATATQSISDVTHYLDGEKELMKDEMEDEMEDQLGEDDDDDDDDEMEMEEIENKEVVEPIVVTAGDKTEITKNFTNDAMRNLKGFLKGMEGIDLRDDYTFDYKDEQYEVEPIINSDENGVSNAVFTIFNGDGEEVGQVDYSREGGKQKFNANSEFFSWNNAKFEDGGFMNNVYADGGEISLWKAEPNNKPEKLKTFKSLQAYKTYMTKNAKFFRDEYSKNGTGFFGFEADATQKEVESSIENLYDSNNQYADGGYFDGAIPKTSSYMSTYADGGGIGFIPMDLEKDLALLAKWGGTNIKGVIGILNAMIDSGVTNEDLIPKPTKNTPFQIEKATEKKIQEIWNRIKPNYKGDFKGNMYYSTLKEMIRRNSIYKDVLTKFKPFRKYQKDSFADGGFLDKYEVDRFKQVMNGKAIAKYIVRLQDSFGNKETYVFGIKIKDQFKGCELVPYESLYGGWSNSGIAFSLDNLQVEKLVPNSFYNIELDEQETEMLVNKLVKNNQAGVEKFLNSSFFYLLKNQSFEDILRGHLARSVARISSVEFEIVQKFADGGFMADVYAKGGSVKKDWWQTVVNPNEDFNNYDDKKPIDWEVDDFKSWVVSNSDLDGNVDKEVLEVIKMPKSKLTVEYLNKNGSGKNNNEYYKKYGNWQSALYDIFTQLKKDYLFKKERKYILKSDIKTVTVKRKGKEVTYNGSDVLNGAYVLAKGGDITSKANYVGKNDIVEVELKDGSKVKPANGYWVKKGAKPITSKQEFTSKDLPKDGSEIKITAPKLGNFPEIDLALKYDSKNFRFDVYEDGVKKDVVGEKEVLNNLNSGIYVFTDKSTPTSSGKSETKVGETYIRKDMRGNWKAETNVDNFNDYDWRISTIKTYSGNLISSAQGGKTESTGTKGIVMFKYTMYEDPNYTLEVSKPSRLTEKVVTEQHEKALAKFKKFMQTGNFGKGGKISKFDKLSAKVAKQYEGKPVKSQFQEEYGKYYSKEEAKEVGDKVAGKVKAMQSIKKEMGGVTKKATSGSEMLKKANILAKEIRKDGESWNDAKKRAFAQLKK